MSLLVLIARVLFGSVLFTGVVSSLSTSLTSGSTLVPNGVINLLIQALNRQTVTSRSNRRIPDPLGTTSRRLPATDVFIRQQQPIDKIIEQAESNSTLLRLADRRQLRRQASTVIEGDIVIDQLELADIDKQIRFDVLEEQILRRFPTIHQTDTALRDRLRAILEQRTATTPVRRKRAARRRRRWPRGQVGVRIASSGFSRAQKNRIAAAMNEISERTCICFNIISRTQALQGSPHVRIVNGNGNGNVTVNFLRSCRSRVGRNLRNQDGTRSQDLTLAPRCRVKRVATHEFLHALGLYHEQSRPDRRRFVRISLRNVESGKRGNFRRYSRATIDSLGIPYDYRSIMHYSSKAFSRNDEFTIVPRPRENRIRFLDIIGKATEMSRNDARAINGMYSCSTPIVPRRCVDYPYRFP